MFQMDANDLLTAEGAPKPYAECKAIFAEDHGISWAAYIVGCLVVLLHEKMPAGTKPQGTSVLVHSHVPEGKGVSSSAAVEVTKLSICTISTHSFVGYSVMIGTNKQLVHQLFPFPEMPQIRYADHASRLV